MSRRPSDYSALVFRYTLGTLVILAVFSIGLYSGYKRNFVIDAVEYVQDSAELVFEERAVILLDQPVHFLQPARDDKAGVTVNRTGEDGNLVFVAGFFEGANGFRLMRRDGTEVAAWQIAYSEHFPDTSFLHDPPATDLNIDTHGALMTPDGGIVFNYEYAGSVKLDRCGGVEWTLAHPTHHSVEPAEAGGYWIAGRRTVVGPDKDYFPPRTHASGPDSVYHEDLILHVSEDGEITREMSIPRLMVENGLLPLLTANGRYYATGTHGRGEFVHVNKMGELSSAHAGAFPDFEAGDLVLSLRNYNLVFVVDPDDGVVKWYQTGPWLRQHDPEFHADGRLTIFNNNAFASALDSRQHVAPGTPLTSNIYRVDPATGEGAVVYGETVGQEMLTVIRGKHEVTEAGYLVTEFEGGRIFEVDAAGETVWEFVNRHDAEYVAEVTEARLYPEDYFEVADWRCPSAG